MIQKASFESKPSSVVGIQVTIDELQHGGGQRFY